MLPSPVDITALQRIRSSAHAIARRYIAYAPIADATPCISSIPPPVLCEPDSLVPKLLALGVNEQYAQKISSAVLCAALRLKESCEASSQRREQWLRTRTQYYQDSKSISMIPSTYFTLYTRLIANWCSYILRDFVPRLVRAQSLHRDTRSVSSKRAFNQSAVPELERFFDSNAFPSRLEKYDLAAKSGMEYRQIHVWFQNRRSRWRKEGKELKKRPSNVLVEELENAVVVALLPEDEDTSDDIVSEGSPQSACEGLNNEPPTDAQWNLDASPPHAFPSTYPPLCSYNPFPLAEDKRSFETPWIRARRLRHDTPTFSDIPDVDALASAFAKLSLGGSTRRCRIVSPHTSSQRLAERARSSSPFGFCVPCPPGPHPALVRRTVRPQRSGPSCATTPPTSRSHGTYVGTSMAGKSMKTASPVTDGSKITVSSPLPAPPRRSKRALPRRVPKNPSVHHATARASPGPRAPYSLPHSNTTTMFSASSPASSSDTDTPPSTPPLLLGTLPLSSGFSSPRAVGWDALAFPACDPHSLEDTLSWDNLLSVNPEDDKLSLLGNVDLISFIASEVHSGV